MCLHICKYCICDTHCREMGHTYGKLAPQAINSAAAADGEANFASSDKKNKSDFALWKQAKPGEPAWDSPECARDEHGNLSKGRPGMLHARKSRFKSACNSIEKHCMLDSLVCSARLQTVLSLSG